MADACLKCGHPRTAVAEISATCPNCGAIYAKVEAMARDGKFFRRRAAPPPVLPLMQQEPDYSLSPGRFADDVSASAIQASAANAPAATAAQLVPCRTCGKEISRRAKACPHCGEENPAVVPPAITATPATRTKPAYVVLAGLLLVFWVISLFTSSPSAPPGFGETAAFNMCRTLIAQLSRDPEKAEIPYVSNTGDGSNFRFTWAFNSRTMRMRNGLGLEVPMTGSCTVDASQRRVSSLMLDGKVLY